MTSAIVFDLDGTLVDSAPDLQVAANHMLAEFGKPPLSLEKVTRFIGNGIPNLVRLARLESGLPEAVQERMQSLMLANYTAHPADLTRPYPGVVDALVELRDAGYRLGVCTNKFRAPSVQILEALDLSQYFDVVIGGDSLTLKKPDPAPLHAAFAALKAPALLYVGDSEVDAETAERAQTAFALYTRGYRKTPVEDLTKRFAFEAYDQLVAKIRSL